MEHELPFTPPSNEQGRSYRKYRIAKGLAAKEIARRKVITNAGIKVRPP
jgi:hypothetical protein